MSNCPLCTAKTPCRWFCPVCDEHHPVTTLVADCIKKDAATRPDA